VTLVQDVFTDSLDHPPSRQQSILFCFSECYECSTETNQPIN